jgi:hypothetical protein
LEEQVLDKCQHILSYDYPDTLRIMRNLSSTYRSQRKYEKAAKLEEQC